MKKGCFFPQPTEQKKRHIAEAADAGIPPVAGAIIGAQSDAAEKIS